MTASRPAATPPQVGWRDHGRMMVATLLIATSFPVVEAIAGGLDALVLTFFRFLLASLLFLPFIAFRYGLAIPGARDLGRYATVSACMVGFFWAMFEALRTTSALNTGALFTFVPGIAALVAAVLLGERLGPRRQIALVLGSVGALWVVFRGDPERFLALQFGRGDLIFLLGCIAFGFYTPLVKLLHRGEPMPVMTFWSLTTGSFWLLLLAGPRLMSIEWGVIAPRVYLGVLYLAAFTTLITFFLTQYSTVRLGPTKVMAYSYMTPALVLGLTWLLGRAPADLMVLPGVLIVLGATLVLQDWLGRGRRPAS